VGDADIGERSNIGAATIFANYDGMAKHHTTVGAHVFTGSDTVLVAPLTIGDGAYTAAGSVVTEDVPAGAIAVARGRQHNAPGWVEQKRPGTGSAAAAARARQAAASGTVAPEAVAPEAGAPGTGAPEGAADAEGHEGARDQ
jgi:bifunctional UDP-N-acetylglucosamine pyrophosphorylase/glucosamine-1-phosphate N-acetyltransferase